MVQPAAAHAVAAGAPTQVQRFEIAAPGSRPISACTASASSPVIAGWSVTPRSSRRDESLAVHVDAVVHDDAPARRRGVHAQAGAKLAVEIGYRGTEEATTDRSEVGFYFDKATRAVWRHAVDAGGRASNVRAGRQARRARAPNWCWTRPRRCRPCVRNVGPGTSSLELTAVLPDGGVRPLLWLREHRLDWPSSYVYLDAVPLPRGSRLVMTTYVTNAGDAADQIAAPSAPDARPAPARARSEAGRWRHVGDFLDTLGAGGARRPPAGRGWPTAGRVRAPAAAA